MISLGHLIFLGVMERFPKLRVSFLEGNGGMATLLARTGSTTTA